MVRREAALGPAPGRFRRPARKGYSVVPFQYKTRKILARYLLGYIGEMILFLTGQEILPAHSKTGEGAPPPFLLLRPAVRLDSGTV